MPIDEKKTITKLRNLSVPIVGFDRPVIMILINFQPENKSPYFLSTNYQKSNFEKSLIPILNNLSKSKGVFLELPIFDLRDIKNNSEFNLLEDPKKCSGINPIVLNKTIFGWILTLIVVSATTAFFVSQGAYAPQTSGY